MAGQIGHQKTRAKMGQLNNKINFSDSELLNAFVYGRLGFN